MNNLNPIKAVEEIKKKYIRYLTTSFKINNPEIQNQFRAELEKEEKISKGPYLDVANSFQKGKSIEELIKDGILVEEFNNFKTEQFPFKNHQSRLYKHQESALKKSIAGRNIIVSTGTGSGKTESFVIPILNHLLKEKQEGTLKPGVRALILYPMNALANDQMKRFRKLLKTYPDITFGSFTGETFQSDKSARDNFKQQNGEEVIPNEIISREKMRDNPPNILITNYAMLEYLMLRPEDNVFFNGEYSDSWKYIVMDEAHTYNGATGIEVAMLMRRLKECIGKTGNIQFILTSASLGGGEKDYPEIAKFGEKLSGEKFEVSDIIGATRIIYNEEEGEKFFDFKIYEELKNSLENKDEIIKILKRDELINYVDEKKEVEEMLYELIIRDKNFYKIKEILKEPKTLVELGSEMDIENLQDLVNFIEVASRAVKDDTELFKSKYHYFVKSLEGGYLALGPKLKFSLNRKIETDFDGERVKVFEISTCKYCNEIYIVGKMQTAPDGKKKILVQKDIYQNEDDFDSKTDYFLLKNSVVESNEDELNSETEDTIDDYILCGKCGGVYNSSAQNGLCDCEEKFKVNVLRINKKSSEPLHTCKACSSTNTQGSVLKRFVIGAEGATAALGTALYEALPEKILIKDENTQTKDFVDEEDFFGSSEKEREDSFSEKKLSKQYLVFSDSRQSAAYYATFMNESYEKILRKRVIYEVVSKLDEEISVKELVNRVAGVFNKNDIFDASERKGEAWKSVLYEVFDVDRRYSLEGLGLLNFRINFESLPPKAGILIGEEVNSLFQIFMKIFREKGAVDIDFSLTEEDMEYFSYSKQKSYVREKGSDLKNGIIAWVPEKKDNSRSEFVKRVLNLDKSDSMRFLEGVWTRFVKAILNQYVVKELNGSRLKSEAIRVIPGKNIRWYYCQECNKITPYNVKNYCPTYSCKGRLIEVNPDKILKDNHYRELAKNLSMTPLNIKEHTAQLSGKLAYELQNKFIEKEINVLSCSTTFEMGVDVGELETVFMRNMPPSPANYAQRAGRAGRRGSSSAFAMTFCGQKSHDFNFYKDPVDMIKGVISPPKFDIENEKIIRRHIYAVCFSFFWKKNKDVYNDGKVIDLFKKESVDKFKEYLNSKPVEILEFLEKILSEEMKKRMGIYEWSWLNQLFYIENSDFHKAEKEYLGDIEQIKRADAELREKISKNENKRGEFFDLSRLEGMKNNLESKRSINYLSQKNLLPKYGFPVDTVELHSNDNNELSLSRDLAIAISEYAPGSQIVANGKLITSRYLKTVPKLNWITYAYGVCKGCEILNQELSTKNEDIQKNCTNCGEVVELKNTYVIPAFGFRVNSKEEEKAGTKKPKKHYSSDVYSIGDGQELNKKIEKKGSEFITMANYRDGELGVISKSKFFICEKCGYGEEITGFSGKVKSSAHKNHMGYDCRGQLKNYNLGHRFKTDIVVLEFSNQKSEDKNLSILYGLLEGVSNALNIERSDIAGCLKRVNGKTCFVFYDTVPGGAGHVKRIMEDGEIDKVLRKTGEIVGSCECGAETSCYSCLRDYSNQKYHDILSRGSVIEFLEELM